MSDCMCPYEALIRQSHKELYGNGNKGMVKEFVELKTEFKVISQKLPNFSPY